ncbi:Thiamine-monophosphate kinase, partial [hydrothermal vent metagenome]
LLGKQAPGTVPEYCIHRLNRPEPQIQAGLLLTRIPRVAAIDISDGLLADLAHICEASQTGAKVYLDKIPLSNALKVYYQRLPVNQPEGQIDWQSIISAGDDYELCFSCGAQSANEMLALLKSHHIPVTQIGEMTSSEKIEVFNANGCLQTMQQTGYKHFNNEK